MTDTTNLDITLIPEGSLQPWVPGNAAFNKIDAAVAGTLAIEFTADANLTLSESQYQQSSLVFTEQSVTLTAGRDVIYPSHFPMMYVKNETGFTLTLKKSGQSGINLATGAAAVIASGITDVVSISGGGGSVAGADKQVQYNNAGAFGAEAGFEYDASTNTLTVANITATGLLLTAASSTSSSGFRVPHGTAPTTPTNGDVWTTTAGMFVRVNGATVGPLSAGGGGSLTGFTSSLETAAPNNLINVSKMLASGGTASQDIALQPTATGSILAQTPDSTATGGNKRGTNSVDLQMVRSAATQVASGAESFIGAGRNNTAGGANAGVVAGQSNSASAQNAAVVGGTSGSASGQRAVVLGGNTGSASGNDSASLAGGTANAQGAMAFGIGANTNSVVSAVSEGSGSGSYPRSRYTLQGSTTSATPVTLTTNAGAAAATNQVYFGNLNNRSGIYRGLIVARQTGNSGGKKSWSFTAHLDRDNGTLALVAAVTPTVVADSGVAWTVAVTADNTLKTLKVEATGAAATTIRWACYVDGQEVDGT